MQTSIRRPPSGGVVVDVQGSFEIADAKQLWSMASTLETGGPVMLDFHEVRSASDAAITTLARGLLELPGHVSIVGLSEHHHRLLRYFGLATESGRRSHGE